MTETALPPLTKRIYVAAQAWRLAVGFICLVSGAFVGWGATGRTMWVTDLAYQIVLKPRRDRSITGDLSAGQLELLAILAVPLLVFGILRIVQAYKGLPRLIVTEEGPILETLLRTRSASWDSLGRFELRPGGVSGRQVVAAVTGPTASDILLSEHKLVIPDVFVVRPEDLVIDLNSRCDGAFGTPAPSVAAS